MVEKVKKWYNDLTRGEATAYSLSDTQFFWITTIWLIMFPFVAYAIFYLAKATWKEFLVFVVLELFVLAFKYAKYIKVNHAGATVELHQKEENNV